MENDSDSDQQCDPHELLLYAARNGDVTVVQNLLEDRQNRRIQLDISCKGKAKSNLGWTPLHLATYFGHSEVANLLLTHGADGNVPNDAGDTPLHKAAFIGHEELLILLLRHGVTVSVMNGEGKVPRDLSKTQDIHKLLLAAENNEQRERELKLLAAAREGDVENINKLLRDSQPPNINCVDTQGNSCLHCASYRGHTQLAVILLQNGIDSTIRNINGQTAVDLAKDSQMRQVLSVRPVQQIQRTATRFEGQLLKRSRFLGWKSFWAVLQRGVLSYYSSRGEANSGSGGSRVEWKYLDSARLTVSSTDSSLLTFHFSDGTTQRLRVPPNSVPSTLVVRQEWITAFKEHIAYSAYYLWGCERNGEASNCADQDEEEETGAEEGQIQIQGRPLGSMRDSLTDATNHLALLESQLGECGALVSALEKSIHMGTTLHQSTYMRFQHVASTGQRLLSTLKHCAALVQQADETRGARLRAEKERCRVLEEALAVLAAEHHDLEQSFAEQISENKSSSKKQKRPSRFYDNSDDEFYDAFAADSDSDTIVSGGNLSPLGALSSLENTPRASRDTSPNLSPSRGPQRAPPPLEEAVDALDTALSPASSCGTIMTCDGHVYKNARDDIERAMFMLQKPRTSLPVPMFSRNDFSLWSVLKNCIGKELSKITMPVVFNEPLSFLQRMLEYLEYAKLLRLAAEQEDPVMRMRYIAGFAVSALASNRERLGKPFNPLLGETYELQRPEFRAVAEQVSHHPPVSAFHADSPHFIFHGYVHPKLRFWGKSVEIQPKGQVTVELPRWGEAYTWSNVNCCVHNIIVGRLWMEQYGSMEVVCHSRGTPGLRAQLSFKPAGWASKDLHRVEGFIFDHNKKKINFLYGKWTDFIKCCDMPSYEEWNREQKKAEDGAGGSGDGGGKAGGDSPAHTPRRVLAKLNSLKVGAFKSVSLQESDEPPIPEPADGEIPKSDSTYSLDIPNSTTLWEATPRPDNSSEYYQFTSFAMSLNELEASHGREGSRLCPTDSRLRPDVRCLERGDVDGAAREKTRLEDKQRSCRKQAKKHPQGNAPRWFSQGTNPYTKQEDWLYNGGYWDRNYEHLANIQIF